MYLRIDAEWRGMEDCYRAKAAGLSGSRWKCSGEEREDEEEKEEHELYNCMVAFTHMMDAEEISDR